MPTEPRVATARRIPGWFSEASNHCTSSSDQDRPLFASAATNRSGRYSHRARVESGIAPIGAQEGDLNGASTPAEQEMGRTL